MRIAELFRRAREAKGLKQSDIADQCGISRSALARFETGSLRLAEETLLLIAPLLDIDPEFLRGNAKIPFKSPTGSLIKYVVDKYHVNSDVLLSRLLALSDVLEIYYLSPPLTIVDRIRHLNVASNPTYALLMKDEAGNVYLFRCKSPKDFLAWDDSISSWQNEQRKMAGKGGHFEPLIISKELFEKIRDWQDIDKEDLDAVFSQKTENLIYKGIALSEAEKKLILFIRDHHLDPEETIQKLQQ
ncbi:helix-turn-helix domain-containing protein [Trichlorobacter lovleyi]|uniref:Transcriptional regulator, XRE family n=1 Tax=Trichlorobacter lovleyi (strain ATCC BAA-1151 / DSM 17278 / SZ) TaxID=398767 RepID=B3E517_TRIL1|nr:helix-turn-helix domain-containing protein [Trichlorobacter lovleyi]ACD94582.1 transcriptional regulator, XRE family [Trichlorobacter lovleyi SZ]